MKNCVNTFIFVSICILFSIANGSAQVKTEPCTGSNDLTQDEISKILDLHNDERSDLDIPKFKWDCSLADLAHEWTMRGIVEHRDTYLGENIFVASDRKADVEAAFKKWMGEKAFWNMADQTCQLGKVCLHYSQIVSRETNEMGCGVNRNTPGKWPLFLVCNYGTDKD